VKLDALAKFWMTYAIHALPKEETNREVRAAQMEAWWLEDPMKEIDIDNDFPLNVEFFFKSDPSWVICGNIPIVMMIGVRQRGKRIYSIL
jgi:hypothetical protein